MVRCAAIATAQAVYRADFTLRSVASSVSRNVCSRENRGCQPSNSCALPAFPTNTGMSLGRRRNSSTSTAMGVSAMARSTSRRSRTPRAARDRQSVGCGDIPDIEEIPPGVQVADLEDWLGAPCCDPGDLRGEARHGEILGLAEADMIEGAKAYASQPAFCQGPMGEVCRSLGGRIGVGRREQGRLVHDERRVTNTYQEVEIPEAVLHRIDDEVTEDLAGSFGLEFGEYFVFHGAIEPKKNVSRIIDANIASGPKRPLVIVSSKGWQNRNQTRKINDERFVRFRMEGSSFVRHRQVRRLNYLPQHQLLHLIKGAWALFFPSV